MELNDGRLAISKLTVKEIIAILRKHGASVPREVHDRKEPLLEYVRRYASPEVLEDLVAAVQEKVGAAEIEKEGRKRKREEVRNTRRTARKIEELETDEVHDLSRFLEVPTADEMKSIYRKWYRRTSNAAVAMFVCGVCAREVDWGTDLMKVVELNGIPNVQRLVPAESHPAHDLYDGKLLEPAGVTGERANPKVNVCAQCWNGLSEHMESPPQYSLANNLWIGRIPWELSILTLPEQLLIALLYPRVFVFKLHPICKGRFDSSQLQRGMRGTVSTYDLDMEGISAMISGDLMPRPLEVLASVISVTYVGLGELPKNWLLNTFRVRRDVVRRSLCRLKAINPKYYGSIKIDSDRIQALPEDDVPLVITSLVRQSTDTGIIDQESDGYVPQHEEFEMGEGKNSHLSLAFCVAYFQ
jgi:hypothetical protein